MTTAVCETLRKTMNNYDKMLADAQKRCAGYDMTALAAKKGVEETPEYLKTCFLGQEVRICKADAAVTVDGRPAGFGEALSVYDWLCDRKADAAASGDFCPVSSLPGVYVSGKGLGMNMPKLSACIHEDPARFHTVMASLGAHKLDLGDIGYRLDIFPDLPMCLKFYFGDDEFPPVLNLLWDKNILRFVRYETVYYIAGCLHERLKELL